MNRRERLRRAYCHEEMDRPAVYSRTGYPHDDPTYDALKAYLAEHSELKQGWGGRHFETALPVTQTTEPVSRDWERAIYTLHTPRGDLRATSLSSLRGQPGLQETFLIKSREDAETYLSLQLPEIGGDVASFFVADREMGDQGIVDVGLGSNPGGLVATLCGSTAFAVMSVTDRDVLHALCEREMEIVLRVVRFLLGQGVGPFFSLAGEEYIVPPLHGPRDFYDFNVRYDKPILDLIHDSGGRMHIHCHASVKRVFAGFLAMGVDVLHPCEAPPMGDITPAEARALAGGRLCLEGNIQINRMYEATPEELAEETRALMAEAFGPGQGLIVSPTASPYIRGAGEVAFPRYKAMVEAVLAWKG